MPSTKQSDLWFARITAPHTLVQPKVQELKESIDIEKMAIGYHTGKRTAKEHIHIAIKLRKVVQQQSINKRLKTLFGVSGADYSSKIWDGSNKVISYLYHDDKGKVEFHNMEFTQIEIDEIKRVHETYKEIVNQAKTKASNRIPDQILDEIKESGKTWTTEQILTRILTGVSRGEIRHPGDQLIIRYTQEIQIRQNPKREINKFKNYYLTKMGVISDHPDDYVHMEVEDERNIDL